MTVIKTFLRAIVTLSLVLLLVPEFICAKPSGTPAPSTTEKESGNIIYVHNEADFKREVLNSKLPVVVEYSADWCGACKMIKPLYARLSGEYQGVYKFVAINADECSDMCKKHGVGPIPHFDFYKDGEKINQLIGATKELEKVITAYFSSRGLKKTDAPVVAKEPTKPAQVAATKKAAPSVATKTVKTAAAPKKVDSALNR